MLVNRINFLAGRYPQPVDRPSVTFVDLNFDDLCSGIPSELLQNRADIRQAEREVAATGLDVKVARARFYPSLNLTGGLGWNAFSTGYLFQTPLLSVWSWCRSRRAADQQASHPGCLQHSQRQAIASDLQLPTDGFTSPHRGG